MDISLRKREASRAASRFGYLFFFAMSFAIEPPVTGATSTVT